MRKLITAFSLSVFIIALCSCGEQIVNGDFASGTLSPGWTDCTFPFYGGVTSVNTCFVTEYNLSLRYDDCFEQELRHPVTATSSLTFWSACPIIDQDGGQFFARVYYSDGSSVGTEIPRTFNCDTHHSVPINFAKQVTKVRFRTLDAQVPWYVTLVSLEGY